MLRKMILVAMVVGVVAALALPAAASANWKHHATNLQTAAQIGTTGNVRFQGGIGGVECQVTSRVKFNPGTTGVAETFVPHPTDATTNCRGLGGLGPCQIHNIVPQAPNWTIHTATATTISVTTTDITSQLTGGIFCLVKAINLTGGTVTLTPNQPNTVSQLELAGGLQADIQTSGGTDKEPVTVSGNLSIESPNGNTYSI